MKAHYLPNRIETLLKVLHVAVKPYFLVLDYFPGKANSPSHESGKGTVQANSPQKYSCFPESMSRALTGTPYNPDILSFIECLVCTYMCKHTVVNAGITELHWVGSVVLKDRQKRKYFTHSQNQEHEGPSLLYGQEVEERRKPHGNSGLILPVKGINGYQTLPTSPIKWWEGESMGWRGKLVILLWQNLRHGNTRTGEKKPL